MSERVEPTSSAENRHLGKKPDGGGRRGRDMNGYLGGGGSGGWVEVRIGSVIDQ